MTLCCLLLFTQPPIFHEDFESGSLAAWGDNRGNLRIVEEGAYKGKRCLEVTANPGKGAGGHIVRWFLPGYDEVWVRWAVKFAPDFDQGNHMHLCALAGNRVDDKWSAFGKAGKKPTGTDFFVTNLEPWRDWGRNEPPGVLMLYSYWPDMQRSRDGMYWGNNLLSNPPLMVPRGKWTVWTLWMKLNEPGKANGEQAFWMDGKPGGRWKGMRFRDTLDLRLNSLSLDLYIHDSKQVNRVWFDEVEIGVGTPTLMGVNRQAAADAMQSTG